MPNLYKVTLKITTTVVAENEPEARKLAWGAAKENLSLCWVDNEVTLIKRMEDE